MIDRHTATLQIDRVGDLEVHISAGDKPGLLADPFEKLRLVGNSISLGMLRLARLRRKPSQFHPLGLKLFSFVS